MAKGFRFCPVALDREHESKARAVLLRHGAVVPGSVRYDGWRLSYQLDLGALEDGAGPQVEEIIRRDIEKAVRP